MGHDKSINPWPVIYHGQEPQKKTTAQGTKPDRLGHTVHTPRHSPIGSQWPKTAEPIPPKCRETSSVISDFPNPNATQQPRPQSPRQNLSMAKARIVSILSYLPCNLSLITFWDSQTA